VSGRFAASLAQSPLRRRPFALLWSGALVSDLGDWMLLIGLPVFVFQLTGSALTTSTVFVAELIPALVVGQVGGVLVDRWDRRRILVVASLLQAALLLPLLAVDSGDRLWIVYLVAAAQSGLARVCSPATAALIPSLVPRDELASANAMNAVGSSLARLVGSPVGGLAIQLLGLPGVVAVDAATFVLSALLVTAIRVPAAAAAGDPGATGAIAVGERPAERPRLVADWLDGLRTIVRTPRLGPAIAIGAASQVAQGIFVVLFVVFVLDVLRADGAAVGLIRGVQAIGGIVAGIGIGLLHGRVSNRALVGWGFVCFGVIALVTWNLSAVTDAVPVYVALFMIVGIPAVATSVGLQSHIQAITPPSHLGRVFAAFETGAGALQAVGVIVAGALADRLGVLPILNVQGSIYVLCGIAALVLLRERAAGRTGQAA
jgi:MFS family permease